MKKLFFLFLILVVVSCKDKGSDIGVNRADQFVGTYYANPVKDNRSSFYVWVVTRKANNRLGIAYYADDSYRFGNQGTSSRKKEVFFLENVVITADSSFTINESAISGGTAVKLIGSGRLVKRDDGSASIDVSIDYVGSDNKAVRSSDQVSLVKIMNLLDTDPSANDFDYAGNYKTELVEDAKTAFHDWTVTVSNNTSFSIDYKIRDKYNQGAIAELINNYVLHDVKKVGSQSISVDVTVPEEISRDQIRIRAVGNKLLRAAQDVPRIAVVVEIINETQGINRIEYLELKKQM